MFLIKKGAIVKSTLFKTLLNVLVSKYDSSTELLPLSSSSKILPLRILVSLWWSTVVHMYQGIYSFISVFKPLLKERL